MKIILSQKQRRVLKGHAQNYFPYESCALLFGKADKDTAEISEIFLAQNTEKSSVSFTISNDELIRGYSKAESIGLDVVGIFHSHPHSEAVPSSTDRKFMEINPVVWIIYSSVDDNFKAYLLDKEILDVNIES